VAGRILVAAVSTDVERFVRAVIRRRTPDACVTTAASGREALALAVKQQQDLLILDSQLPDLGGVEVTRRLRKLAVLTPVVLIVPRSSRALARLAKQTAIQDLLPTPVEYGKVVSALAEFVQGKRRQEPPNAL